MGGKACSSSKAFGNIQTHFPAGLPRFLSKYFTFHFFPPDLVTGCSCPLPLADLSAWALPLLCFIKSTRSWHPGQLCAQPRGRRGRGRRALPGLPSSPRDGPAEGGGPWAWRAGLLVPLRLAVTSPRPATGPLGEVSRALRGAAFSSVKRGLSSLPQGVLSSKQDEENLDVQMRARLSQWYSMPVPVLPLAISLPGDNLPRVFLALREEAEAVELDTTGVELRFHPCHLAETQL